MPEISYSLSELRFISAGAKYSTLEKSIPAPYIRKTLMLSEKAVSAPLTICGLGFYELYINGTNITKGKLAPYISNPDHLCFFDRYEIAPYLRKGKNVIGIILGNGKQNNFGGFIWSFQKAAWVGAPRAALGCEIFSENEKLQSVFSDESFVYSRGPILLDDEHLGEDYDARLRLKDWSTAEYDDSAWKPCNYCEAPRGERRLSTAEPIRIVAEKAPVSVERENNGYRYDFGVNSAGFLRLKIKGEAGQRLHLVFGEVLSDGKTFTLNTRFREEDRSQEIYFTCSGDEDIYEPRFAYFGYRYIFIEGITEKQAEKGLLTMLIAHSQLESAGSFSCSNETVNKIQALVRQSNLDNFFYFPTDCPQREKNGWTGDAALSCEQMLYNHRAEHSLAEWLRSVCRAQTKNGDLPGIVPTEGWGLGCGPCWDSVIVIIPYYLYTMRGNIEAFKESAPYILRWLYFLRHSRSESGLIETGLGDWEQPGQPSADVYTTPVAFTSSCVAMDAAKKAAYLFEKAGCADEAQYALALSAELRQAIREKLIDKKQMTVCGGIPTAQAMALFYGIFEQNEIADASERLTERIISDGRLDSGVIGAKVLFDVMADIGKTDLILSLITRPEWPSYGNIIKRGATSLWEGFPPEGKIEGSYNHHFWGFVSEFFYTRLAGIRINPNEKGADTVLFAPSFAEKLDSAEASVFTVCGDVSSAWCRKDDTVQITLTVPKGLKATLRLPTGYRLSESGKAIAPGINRFTAQKIG